MTVTLNLAPETNRRLQEKAARFGLGLEAYLHRLAEREAFDGNGAAPAKGAANHSCPEVWKDCFRTDVSGQVIAEVIG
ncbi:MAG TPA: hypothetical protein VMS17_20785 [Gemmataceae bacterium]|nr:hypothetical protein [Gemmataceae bacterium]